MAENTQNPPSATTSWEVLSALYLCAVSLISLFLVAYFLSAFQAYQRIQSAKIGDAPLSFYTLKRYKDETALRDAQIDVANAALRELDIKRNENLETITTLDADIQALENKQDELIASVAREAAKPTLTELKGNYKKRRSLVVEQLKGAPENEAIKTFLAEDKTADFDALNKLKKVPDLSNKAIDRKKRELLVQIKEIIEERRSFGNEVDAAKQTKIMDLVEEMRQTQLPWYFFNLPEETLVIAIVIFGGLLGSAVFLTYDFVDATPPRSFAYYSLRFLVGALTSLLLFIVIKAGVIVAIDSHTLGRTNADLNPFFVAFVGVVGGLISTQVVTKIMASANTWFHDSASDKERYALPAAIEALSDQDARTQFVQLTGYSGEAVDRWLRKNALVLPAGQRAVSLFLKRELRELFSDIPPSQLAPENASREILDKAND